jgi:hypothetical protein
MRGGGRFSSLWLASTVVVAAMGELRDAEARCVNTTTGVEVTGHRATDVEPNRRLRYRRS